MFAFVKNYLLKRKLTDLLKLVESNECHLTHYKDSTTNKFASAACLKGALSEIMILQKDSVNKTMETIRDISCWYANRADEKRDESGYSPRDKWVTIFDNVFCIERSDGERVVYIFSPRPGLIIGKAGEAIDSLEKFLGMRIMIVEDTFDVEYNYGMHLMYLDKEY